MGYPLSKKKSAEEAEAETRQQFAVRANAILAFIECDESLRPKLREAIVEGQRVPATDWLAALEVEVSMVRCRRRHQSSDETPRSMEQVRLSWDEWQREIADDAA